MMVSCIPSKHFVNVERSRNYYQRHRYNTYTIPLWTPGVGILLETRTFYPHNKWKHPVIKRKRR
jgi:hypothetical protein